MRAVNGDPKKTKTKTSLAKETKAFKDSAAMYENYIDQLEWLARNRFTQDGTPIHGGFMDRYGSGEGNDGTWSAGADRFFALKQGSPGFYGAEQKEGLEGMSAISKIYDLKNPEDSAYVASLRDADTFWNYDSEGFARYDQEGRDSYYDKTSNRMISREQPPDLIFRDDMAQAASTYFGTPSGERYALGIYAKPKGYDEYQKRKNRIQKIDSIPPKSISQKYSTPEILPMKDARKTTGRPAVQVGRLALDRANARHGQVLDSEYIWDQAKKKWQRREVDEERKGHPFIKGSF
tara:strand:- start:553 stop:1428 length:876 start_codon:yes stop_codon:yes gene_type:complete